MNRWWGNQEDSDRQTSERNSRAARRIISQQPVLSSDEEPFLDADTSIHDLSGVANLDGADDIPEDDMNAAELARQKALPFEDADYENDPESWKKELKIKFDMHEVEYTFNTIEAQMKKFGINRQWDKKDTLVTILPEAVIQECMPILRLSEADAGPTIYKSLKEEILQLYGSKEEDAFKKAISLKMTGTPSSFGKRLIHIICPGAKPFVAVTAPKWCTGSGMPSCQDLLSQS